MACRSRWLYNGGIYHRWLIARFGIISMAHVVPIGRGVCRGFRLMPRLLIWAMPGLTLVLAAAAVLPMALIVTLAMLLSVLRGAPLVLIGDTLLALAVTLALTVAVALSITLGLVAVHARHALAAGGIERCGQTLADVLHIDIGDR